MIHPTLTGFPHLLPADMSPATGPTRLSRLPLPDRRPADDFDNWDSLLVALSGRLRATVSSAAGDMAGDAMRIRVRDQVLQCADDLDLLHIALNTERDGSAVAPSELPPLCSLPNRTRSAL